MWLRSYRKNGIEGLKTQIGKHRGPNKVRPKGSCKMKTPIEELQRENLKLQVEIERLKKGYFTKGVGDEAEFENKKTNKIVICEAINIHNRRLKMASFRIFR